jgi:nitrite reductase/ring-hydroxylating ferredoxin subunit
MRRYWQPVALAADATVTPRQVRLLGEDLILFRDGQGRAGLVYSRCTHRGTTLYYGKVEEHGIRCCYHGWLFDVEGNCLDQPCEPEGGVHRDKARQPWYPVQERYGIVFAYMGPPSRQRALPRYDILENVPEGQELIAFDNGLGTGGDGSGLIAPCNWLQHWENIMDPFHVAILHSAFSGTQFVPEMAVMPEVDFTYVETGVRSTQIRRLDGGRLLRRVTEVMFPSLRLVPSPLLAPGPSDAVGWTVPVDNTHYKIITAMKVKAGGAPPRGSVYDGKRWSQLDEAEHQAMPRDYEAQTGQGAITLHSEENLMTTDKGVGMLRRLLRQQIETVASGGDPAGVAFGAAQPPVRIATGNYFSG